VITSLPTLHRRLAIGASERNVRTKIKEVEAVLMADELKARRRVLRRLGHLSEEGVIQNKGRVACELSTADELLTTELVFSGLLNELEPGPLAALLSCLVTETGGAKGGGGGGKGGKGKEEPDPVSLIKTKTMVPPFEKLREHARHVATTVEECRLPIDVKEYVDGFGTDLVDVVIKWCEGAKFIEVVDMCSWFEGSIIRTFHRLEELLRQLIDAAKVVGNDELEQRCAAARTLLVRDVVFAASLYT